MAGSENCGLGLVVAASLILAAPASANTFLWPWQQHGRHHRHHVPKQPAPLALPDCDEINAEVKKLPPDRYERALRSATKEQQQIIANCAVQP